MLLRPAEGQPERPPALARHRPRRSRAPTRFVACPAVDLRRRRLRASANRRGFDPPGAPRGLIHLSNHLEVNWLGGHGERSRRMPVVVGHLQGVATRA